MATAITATGWASIRSDGISRMYFEALSKKYRFSLTQPYDSLSDEVKNVILYGTGGEKLELHYDQPRGKGVLYQAFEGICNNLEPVSYTHLRGHYPNGAGQRETVRGPQHRGRI